MLESQKEKNNYATIQISKT